MRIWLGMSRQTTALVPQLVSLLVHQLELLRGPGGARLLGIVCNGEEAWRPGQATVANPGPPPDDAPAESPQALPNGTTKRIATPHRRIKEEST